MIAKKYLSSSLLLASALLVLPSLRATLPDSSSANLTVGFASGGTVTPGVVGSTLTITSTAPTTVLNWGNFWDGTAEGGTSAPTDTIHYTLPLATSSLLNVVAGTGTTAATTIAGSITSNGKIFLLNPNGITIGATGIINTAGFYASSVPENISYFEQNGNLQVFTTTPQVAATTGAITVTNGASITTAGSTGDLRLAANGVTLQGGTIAGNVYVVDLGAASPVGVSIGTVATEIVSGVGNNLTITAHSAPVTLSATGGTTVPGNLVITSGGGLVNLAQTGATAVTGTSSITTTGNTNGNVTTGTGTFTSGATTVVTGTGASASDGTVNIGGLSLGTNPITVTGGATTLTDTTDATLTLGNLTLSGNLAVTTTGNLTTQNFGSTAATPATLVQTGTGLTVALTADSASAGSKTLTFNGTGAENFTTLAMPGATESATITTTGNLSLNTGGSISIGTLSLATTAGTITEGASTNLRDATLTLNAPTVTLNSATNAANTLVLLGGGTGGISFTETNGVPLVIGNGTAATGNVSITNLNGGAGATSISLGATNTDVLSFGGNLSLNLSAAIAPASEQILTAAGTISVTGNTTITSTGQAVAAANNSVTLGTSGGTDTFTGPISTTINNTGGPITYFGSSALILGATNTGNATSALSVTSSVTGTGNTAISNPSGIVTNAGATILAAGTIVAPSNIQIGGTSNPAALAGAVTLTTANNFSLTNSVATHIAATTNPVVGQTSITQSGTGAASAVTISGSLANLSIADTAAAPTGNVAVTIPTGNVALSNWTVNGTGVTAAVTVTNGSITLGSGINDSNLSTTTFTATGANAAIADTASSPVSIYGAVTFNSDGPINVSNNTSSSLGGITLNATTTGVAANNSNITYTEGSGVNLQGISVPATYTGIVAVTSVNSIILETAASVLTLPTTSTLTLTANSANGALFLNAVGATNAIQAPISLTTTGNSSYVAELTAGKTLALGSIAVSAGTFSADTSATAAIPIVEGAGATVVVSGATTLTTQGGAITVNQSGNKYGSLAVDTTVAAAPAGANVTIKEFDTAMIKSINTGTAGNLTLTSETGGLTETGNTGVFVGGATTLAAPVGPITFNATGNDFNGSAATPGSVTITTNGAAGITDKDAITQLGGGTNVAGNLTVTNVTASNNGVIKDNGSSGNVTVGGTLFLITPTFGTGHINFTGLNNSIAALEVKTGTGTTTFYDNVNLVLEPGTIVAGPATIASGGAITTAVGPMSFGAGVNFNANGNITLSDTGMSFNGQVTAVVTGATSDVSFSALSLLSNFNSITPSVTTQNNATLYQPPGP